MQRWLVIISKTVENFSLTRRDYALLGLVALIGLLLRILPGTDHLIWDYDQARDSVVIRTILGEKNLMIVGPQTEFFGLNHGPLYYYYAAPFYHLAQWNPNIPLYAMIILNLSTLIPLVLLVQSLFKDRRITVVAALLFAVAYQQVEYARWLSNVAITIPMIAWMYYFLWQTLANNKRAFFTGVFTGLAIQGEFFLIFLIALCYVLFYLFSVSKKAVRNYHIGLLLGLSSFIAAEIKFSFLGSTTFLTQFVGSHSDRLNLASTAVAKYLDHLGMTTNQNVFGITPTMGVWGIIAALLVLLFLKKHLLSRSYVPQVLFVLALLFSHSFLLTFHYVDAVFLNLSIIEPIIILFALVVWLLYQSGQKWAAYLLTFGIVVSQLYQLQANVQKQSPMQLYNFHQAAILLSQKKEIVSEMYRLADAKPFTIGVIGTPYGVQTVWATVFENYLAERPTLEKPNWYGYQALGYPADSYFTKVDHPAERHILVIEQNYELFLSPYIYEQYMDSVNEATVLIEETELYGFKLQLREAKKQLVP